VLSEDIDERLGVVYLLANQGIRVGVLDQSESVNQQKQANANLSQKFPSRAKAIKFQMLDHHSECRGPIVVRKA